MIQTAAEIHQNGNVSTQILNTLQFYTCAHIFISVLQRNGTVHGVSHSFCHTQLRLMMVKQK